MYDDISGNAEQFAQVLDQLGQQIEDDVFNKVIKKALNDLLGEIIRTTPRETCRARCSWMLDDQWSDFALPPGDYTSVDINSLVQQIASALPQSSQYVLYNNLEYIVALENGHSKQAPSGFVAQALAAIGEHVAKAARAAGYEATT